MTHPKGEGFGTWVWGLGSRDHFQVDLPVDLACDEARFLALLQNYTWEYNEVRKLRMKPTVVKNGVAAAA